MKNRTKLLVSAVTLLMVVTTTIFCACTHPEKQLHKLTTPYNLTGEGYAVSWTGTEWAKYYIVEINGKTYTTEDTFYMLDTGEKDFVIRVKAVGDKSVSRDSDYSEYLNYTIEDSDSEEK